MAAREKTQTYSTADAAKWVDVSTSTVIKWDREGTVKPSAEREHGSDRSYSEDDLMAMLLAKEAIEKKLNPYPDSVREIVAMVQRANRQEMKRAQIRLYQKDTGIMSGLYVWVRTTDAKHVAHLERELKQLGYQTDMITMQEDLWSIVERQRQAFQAGFRDGVRAARAARLGKEN